MINIDCEILKQKINNHMDIRKNLWTAFIILTGGIIGLALNIDSIIKIFLLFIGFLSELLLVYSFIINNREIGKCFLQFKKLKEI